MSGPKRNPDKLNTIGVVVVGICGAVLVYVTIVALQAFYVNDTSELQTMMDYGGQDKTAKGKKADELRTINEAGKNAVGPGQEATFRIPIKNAMEAVVEEAKKDPSHLVPMLPPATKPSIEPVFGRPKPAAPAAPAPGAPEAGSAAPAAGSAAPAAGSAAPTAPTAPTATTGAPGQPQPVAGAGGAAAAGATSATGTTAPPSGSATTPTAPVGATKTGPSGAPTQPKTQPKAQPKAPATQPKAPAPAQPKAPAPAQPKAPAPAQPKNP